MFYRGSSRTASVLPHWPVSGLTPGLGLDYRAWVGAPQLAAPSSGGSGWPGKDSLGQGWLWAQSRKAGAEQHHV